MNSTTEIKTLKLDTPVVVRKVPMTARGCDLLRACRDHYVDEYEARRGHKVEIPFPTAIHLILEEYAKLKEVKV